MRIRHIGAILLLITFFIPFYSIEIIFDYSIQISGLSILRIIVATGDLFGLETLLELLIDVGFPQEAGIVILIFLAVPFIFVFLGIRLFFRSTYGAATFLTLIIIALYGISWYVYDSFWGFFKIASWGVYIGLAGQLIAWFGDETDDPEFQSANYTSSNSETIIPNEGTVKIDEGTVKIDEGRFQQNGKTCPECDARSVEDEEICEDCGYKF